MNEEFLDFVSGCFDEINCKMVLPCGIAIHVDQKNCYNDMEKNYLGINDFSIACGQIYFEV